MGNLTLSSYNPLSHLLPDFLPAWGEDEDGLQFGVSLHKQDLLKQHAYALNVLYGLDSRRIRFEAEYLNAQFSPDIHLFGYDRAARYADLFRNTGGGAQDYWERRQGGGINLRLPIYRSRRSDWFLTAGYEYSELDHLTEVARLTAPWPEKGLLASVSAGLIVKSIDRYRYSISPESGVFAHAQR